MERRQQPSRHLRQEVRATGSWSYHPALARVGVTSRAVGYNRREDKELEMAMNTDKTEDLQMKKENTMLP